MPKLNNLAMVYIALILSIILCFQGYICQRQVERIKNISFNLLTDRALLDYISAEKRKLEEQITNIKQQNDHTFLGILKNKDTFLKLFDPLLSELVNTRESNERGMESLINMIFLNTQHFVENQVQQIRLLPKERSGSQIIAEKLKMTANRTALIYGVEINVSAHIDHQYSIPTLYQWGINHVFREILDHFIVLGIKNVGVQFNFSNDGFFRCTCKSGEMVPFDLEKR